MTAAPVRLTGRAPNDVLDQRLFGVRLGCADLVMLAEVDQVWDRGLHGGQPVQHVDLTLGDVLLGHLDKRVSPDQTFRVEVSDPLGGELQAQQIMVFLRWAPDELPQFHHHLMLVEPELLAGVQAQIRHAEKAGKLPKVPKRQRRRKRRKKDSSTGARCGYAEVADIVQAQAIVEAQPETQPEAQPEAQPSKKVEAGENTPSTAKEKRRAKRRRKKNQISPDASSKEE